MPWAAASVAAVRCARLRPVTSSLCTCSRMAVMASDDMGATGEPPAPPPTAPKPIPSTGLRWALDVATAGAAPPVGDAALVLSVASAVMKARVRRSLEL